MSLVMNLVKAKSKWGKGETYTVLVMLPSGSTSSVAFQPNQARAVLQALKGDGKGFLEALQHVVADTLPADHPDAPKAPVVG